jgi:hypothetical protein
VRKIVEDRQTKEFGSRIDHDQADVKMIVKKKGVKAVNGSGRVKSRNPLAVKYILGEVPRGD